MREKGKTKKGCHRSSNYKSDALAAAKDLYYGEEVMNQIRSAKTDAEIEHIMSTARQSR